jgi:hypothetical protein
MHFALYNFAGRNMHTSMFFKAIALILCLKNASSLQAVCVHRMEHGDKGIVGRLCLSVCVCLSVQLHIVSDTTESII